MTLSLSVLIVEDSDDDAVLLVRALQRGGFNLNWQRVETPESLRTALTQHTWDLLLVDYRLPSFDAHLALQIYHQAGLDIPFIVVSGKVGEDTAVEVMKAGAHDYLMKSNLTRLPEAVRRELREAQVRAEHLQASLELQRTKQNLQLAIEGSGIGLWDWSIQANTFSFNDRWAEIIGYTSQQLTPFNIDFLRTNAHPEDLQKSDAALERHFCQETLTFECELRRRHQSGRWVWVWTRGRVVEWDEMGQPLRMTGTTMDISHLKHLQGEQTRLLNILEVSTDYIRMSNAQSQVIWRNTALKRLQGLDQSHRSLQRHFLEEHPLWAQDLIRNQALPEVWANGSWIGETALLDAKGEEIPVSHLILAHPSLPGGTAFYSSIMRDMREQKKVEQEVQLNAELMRATRLKDEFLANMSHELRTPLNAILGLSEAMLDEVFGPLTENQKKSLTTIENSGQHLLELINDILEVSKIEAGKLELSLDTVAVDKLCTSSLAFVKQLALRKQIQLHTAIPNDLGNIEVDERRMRQVLINLLTNAVKFTPEEGHVMLSVSLHPQELVISTIAFDPLHNLNPSHSAQTPSESAADSCRNATPDPAANLWIVFSVSDTGIGIATEDQVKLFQPFVQIDSSINRRYEGTGLGLMLVKQIVELHGGFVELNSQVGQGSCFFVCLPYQRHPIENDYPLNLATSAQRQNRLEPEVLERSLEGDEQTPAAQPLVLLAEDNPSNVDMLTSYLVAYHYQVIVARNGQEAIDYSYSHHPDIILMDIQMPEVDGLTAMRRIRQDPQLAEVPIIALTALAMPADRVKCLEAGATDYLSKPVNLGVLRKMLKRLLSPA